MSIGIYKIFDETGTEVNQIIADDVFMAENYQSEQYALVEMITPPPVTPPSVKIDTPLFIMRFTPQERVAMRQAAKSDSEYAPLIDDWLMILNDPRLAWVELGDPNLIAAMGMMVQLGLLTQERADAVMTP